ncbi:MAG TPA: zinc-ribbon domain-containing protein [Planctomycetota bacterium]|nr:zinc-ribbon domain-containing protein [Planctomycetota bacterium]
MHGVKPGRGPSLIGGIGGIVFIILGIAMFATVGSRGAPPIFLLFLGGILLVAVIGTVYNFWAATTRNRPSTFDITSGDEEYDPIAKALGHGPKTGEPTMDQTEEKPRRFEGEFCPFCGKKVEGEFDFCPHCGKDI